MSDLRLIGSDDGYVLFESLDGTKHRALADDALKSALRKASTQDTSSYVSPRDIQERIRNGESVAQICDETSSPEEYVSKFARPVLDELEHMIESAKSVRLIVPGDRFNDEGLIEFGELISARLEQANAVDVVWSVRRAGATTWDVTVAYTIGSNTGLALWSFDPRRVLLTPENEAASGLSTVEGTSGPITKVRVIADTPAAFRRIDATEPTIAKASTPEATAVEPVATIESLDDLRKKRESAKALEELSKVSIDELQVSEEIDEAVIENDAPIETVAESSLDESFEVFDDVDETFDDLPAAEIEPDSIDESETAAEEPNEPETQTVDSNGDQQTTKKTRAAMPSWDQIVFGTKPED